MTKRDQIAEIAERKARASNVFPAYANAIGHLRDVEVMICELETKDLTYEAEAEVYRGVPVVVVATIESYFRGMVAALIDSGEPFRSRASMKKDIKIDLATLLAMETRSVSLGDLVAHSIALNNQDDLGSAYEYVSGEAFWTRIGTSFEAATGPFLFELTPDLVRDGFYKQLTELYRVRHIVCHENRAHADVGASDAKAYCNSAREFLLTVDYLADELRANCA